MKYSDKAVEKLAIETVDSHPEYLFTPKGLREVLVDNHKVPHNQASVVIEDLICTSRLSYSMTGKVGRASC